MISWEYIRKTGRPADDRAFGFAAVENFRCCAGREEGREGDSGAGAGHCIKGLLAGDMVSLIVDRAGRWEYFLIVKNM